MACPFGDRLVCLCGSLPHGRGLLSNCLHGTTRTMLIEQNCKVLYLLWQAKKKAKLT